MDPGALLVLFIILSGVFSSLEIAFFSLSDAKVHALVEKKVRGAKTVQQLKQNPDELLVMILIGNNIVNIAASAIATVIASDYFANWGVSIAIGLMTIIILIFGEISPKSVATKYAAKIACNMAAFLKVLSYVLFPFIWIFVHINKFLTKRLGANEEKVSEEEVQALARIGVQSGIFEKHEETFIQNIFEFGDTSVEQIMTPRVNMVAIDVNSTLADILPLVRKEEFSRYPVFEDTIDNIVGIFYVRDLILYIEKNTEDILIKDIMKAPLFVPCTNHIDTLFREMKVKRIHIAIVTDEHGGTAGLVTLEDVIEQIVGDINDETDKEEILITQKEHNIWMVHGKAELKLIEEVLGVDFHDPHQSVSSFIIEKLEHMPKQREFFETFQFKMEVITVSPKFVDLVKVTKKNVPIESV